MLYEVMKHCRNFFPAGNAKSGKFTIEDGTISLPFLSNGQYFIIEGSIFNDGVYQYPASRMTNETFEGQISALKPPKDFLSLVTEITAYNAKYNEQSPYTSETFGGYSYTKATNGRGTAATWQDVFDSKLKTWRKI